MTTYGLSKRTREKEGGNFTGEHEAIFCRKGRRLASAGKSLVRQRKVRRFWGLVREGQS